MSKSIYEEALKELTWLVHDEFYETPKHSMLNASQRINMFKKVRDTLEQAQKQEKLLELYRKLITLKDEAISIVWFDADYFGTEMEEEAKDLEKKIKELENEGERK